MIKTRKPIDEAVKKQMSITKLEYYKTHKNSRYGVITPDKTKKKISDKLKGRHPVNEFKKGYIVSDITKKKMRIARSKYIQKMCGLLFPCIGHNEKQILNKLEQELNYKIYRQYPIEGYFIDGYIPDLSIAIEVDEKPKNKEKDIKRQNIIESKLNCKFVRIKDYE